MVDLFFVILFYCGTGHALFWTGWRGPESFYDDLDMAGATVLAFYEALFMLIWPFLLAAAIEGACRE